MPPEGSSQEKSLQKRSSLLCKGSFLSEMDSAKSIEVLGCNPVAELFTSVEFYVHVRRYIERLFEENKNAVNSFSIYIESEQEDFFQKLLDKRGSVNFKLSYVEKKGLIFGDGKSQPESALVSEIVNRLVRKSEDEGTPPDRALLDFAKNNVIVKQLNLRLPFHCIKIDDCIWYCPIALNVPRLEEFILLDKADHRLESIYGYVDSYLTFLKADDSEFAEKNFKHDMGGAKFLSNPGAELIEAYDELTNKRVGIFPRDAFLTKEYKRGSIWGFVFNRRGELLLHQRSASTADNTSLWDKSTGGHIDLTDSSTVETAKRELVEELFIADAEYSDYSDTKMYMVVDFGEWRKSIRQNSTFIEAFRPFVGTDKHIIMFRAFVEKEKKALVVDRPSFRKIRVKGKNGDDTFVMKPTWFRSDVFFYIAAEGQIDDENQMKKTFSATESKGGADDKGIASGHRLISIEKLKEDVSTHPDQYTDDIVFMLDQYWSYLVEFGAFAKEIFQKIK